MNVAITGANGFIGSALAKSLMERDHEVTGLVRNPAQVSKTVPSRVRLVKWNPEDSEFRKAIAAADVVVHLAGASIGGERWNAEYKRLLHSSRIGTTRTVVDAMRRSGRNDQALLSGSAVGYYGDCGDRSITESDGPGAGFLPELCVDWEAEANVASEFGARVVTLRTGIVLGESGALTQMLPPFRLGVGGPLGSGRQWMSWIHLADAAAMMEWAAGQRDVEGPLNVTAPNPVTMKAFAAALGRALHRPALIPTPAFALRLLVGEFADALLTGQKVIPQAARDRGFSWRFPFLDAALMDILR